MGIRYSSPTSLEVNDLDDRFKIAGDRKVTAQQKHVNTTIQGNIENLAIYIIHNIEPSRERALVLTKLEEALMWAGKAIYRDGPLQ